MKCEPFTDEEWEEFQEEVEELNRKRDIVGVVVFVKTVYIKRDDEEKEWKYKRNERKLDTILNRISRLESMVNGLKKLIEDKVLVIVYEEKMSMGQKCPNCKEELLDPQECELCGWVLQLAVPRLNDLKENIREKLKNEENKKLYL